MKKRIMLPLLLEIFAITSTMTVLAAPQTMSDGTVFDAEFYAQTYPDVASVYGTTNTDILYQHYVQFGKAEGRLATSSSDTSAQNVSDQSNAPQQAATGYSVENLKLINDTPLTWKTIYTRNDPNGAWQFQWDGDGIGEGYVCALHNYNLISSYFGAKIICTDGSELILETTNIIPGKNYHAEVSENNGFYAGVGTQTALVYIMDADNICIYAVEWP
ncbi:MAG: hypothetical protein HFG43_12535 [Lachnospiraceae bacterium]|jgi:hypothetical protein|nr:hypothetical protein [Lachnospiraceae bacterium]MCI9591589.1 hypothetical protein [Lachnospiraceae bacterium]